MLKKIAKRLFKILAVIIVLLLVAYMGLYLAYNRPLPEGKMGTEADALAEQMLEAVNKEAWDTTNIIQWSFIDMHHFIWDKKRHLVQVEWNDYKVLLNPNTMDGKIYFDGAEQMDDARIFETAYSHFINDAFWMNGFVQIHNGNPEHRIVEMEDGSKGLLITYTSGGVTPGDSYLWIFDANGLPKAWRMWVGILPIGGIEVSWEDWKTLPTGAKLAQNHNMGTWFNVAISNIEAYQTWEEGGYEKDIFAPIAN